MSTSATSNDTNDSMTQKHVSDANTPPDANALTAATIARLVFAVVPLNVLRREVATHGTHPKTGLTLCGLEHEFWYHRRGGIQSITCKNCLRALSTLLTPTPDGDDGEGGGDHA